MKKDINFLVSLAQAEKRKSSSTMTIVMVACGVIIIGLIVFLFVSAKVDLARKQDVLDDLNQRLEQQDNLAALEQEYAQYQALYLSQVVDVMSQVYPNLKADGAVKMSSNFLHSLYRYNELHPEAEGAVPVQIDMIRVDGDLVAIECSVKTYEDAWNYVTFLAGKGTDPDSAKYSEYFSGVLDGYSGLPVEGDPAEYTVRFSLNFRANWGAFV